MSGSIRYIILVAVISVSLIGCSKGGNTPVTPVDPGMDVAMSDGNIDSLSCENLPDGTFESITILGSYQLSLDKEKMTAELVSSRKSSIGESYIVSGIHFFDIKPCSDCLKVKSVSLTPEGYLLLTFSADHPFAKGVTSKPPSASNRLDLDVFDLALVMVPAYTYLTNYPLLSAKAYADVCINADGYTRELGLVTGKNNACPYFLVMDDSLTGIPTYNRFQMGTKNAYFDTYFLTGGQFNLHLTMGYGASARKFTRLTPTYYNPEFNRKAAWKVEVTPPQGSDPPAIGNTWDDQDSSTLYTIKVRVYDWQQNATVASKYPDTNHKDWIYKTSKVSRVSAEIPGMTAALKSTTTPKSGAGTPSSPLLYEIEMANENKLTAGVYYSLVKVTDERVPPASVNPGQTDAIVHTPNGSDINWYSMPEFATYQIFPATILVGMEITVTSPNGYENWSLSSSQNITWTSYGPIANVKIDLSTDNGVTYPIPITPSTPNSGIYNIPSVGAWTSGHCRIRIANASLLSIYDISDHNFSVNCPLPPAPSNVLASDSLYYNKVTVTWDAVPGATGYNVYRSGVLKQSDIPVTTWDDMNPPQGTVFYYQVSTNNACGEGPEGPPDPGEPGSTCVPCNPPTSLSATDGTRTNRVDLSWSPVTGAQTYNVYRNNIQIQTGIVGTSWSDYSATRGVIYSYQVEAQNTCGPSARSSPDTGYASGCSYDGNNTCATATKTRFDGTVAGCVDQIDEDWYHFYISPSGFTNASTIQLAMASGTVSVYIYGIDPGGTCPGNLIKSALNVGASTVTLPASGRSHIYIKIIGNSGMVDYTMNLNFKLALSNVQVEIYVATTNGTSSGTWPTNGSVHLTHANLVQMMTWANNIWNQYGYNLVWDQTETFISAQYYILNYASEDWEMHQLYGFGGNRLSLYFVDQLYWGNTAYCVVYQNVSQHNVHYVYSVYSPNVWSAQEVIAHEHGHGIGYFQDMYLFDLSPCDYCACGDNSCLSGCLGYTTFLFSDSAACYSGNLMYFGVSGNPWSFYDMTSAQANFIYQFHYTYPSNFPWY